MKYIVDNRVLKSKVLVLVIFILVIVSELVYSQEWDTTLVLSDTFVTERLDYSSYTINDIIRDSSKMSLLLESKHVLTAFPIAPKLFFEKNVDFGNSTFKKVVNFTSCIFNNQVTFNQAKFEQDANFSFSDFQGFTLFESTQFKKDVYFLQCTFQSLVDFTKMNFKILRFDYSRFERSSVYFTHIDFSDSSYLYFDQTVLPDTIAFCYTSKIHNEIDLTVADFSDSSHYSLDDAKEYKRHDIFLYKTDISKIHFDYSHFHLIFNYSGRRYPKITDDERAAIYEEVLQNFKNRGQMDSYKLLDTEYSAWKWENSSLSWLRWLPHWWWNYGYNKEWIFIWVFGFVMLFTLFNFFLLKHLNTQVYTIENIPSNIKLSSWRLWYSFVYTSSIFFSLTLKHEKLNFKRIAGTIYLLLIYTLGLICLAYMANFVLQT